MHKSIFQTNIIRYLIITAEAFYLNKIAIDNKLLERYYLLSGIVFLAAQFSYSFQGELFTATHQCNLDDRFSHFHYHI